MGLHVMCTCECHVHVMCMCCVGGRNLQDVRTRMQHNGEMQRLIAKEAEHVELDMIGQEMNTKTQVTMQLLSKG